MSAAVKSLLQPQVGLPEHSPCATLRTLYLQLRTRVGGGRSSPSVFSSFSSSSRRARPRDGFMQRMVRSIKKLFRDIYRYARKNPIKVFLLVIIPLLTSGILPKLLAMIGVRLPHGIHTALGGSAGPGARAMGGGMENKGLSDSVNSLVSIAKMFA
ncbi:hypothetical protein N7468_008669 [Penicillium chermesinum]|uniref:Uncharacterized protein n=1 Tax=Penicillium chermesinum TaxID=63820 RepID=A0A9W9NQ63_9EURO|nr:uncharacterized protein N7468_008669 [Penicillium chermesinum]KAJ5224127.1 hypothetical protein N7468_008669 [Penicillium chermesinum]